MEPKKANSPSHMETASINIEIVYVTNDKSLIHTKYTLTQTATVNDALTQSGLLLQYPEINELSVGIFSKIVTPTTIVKNGDRIEIYRKLYNDPKEKRKLRAIAQKSNPT